MFFELIRKRTAVNSKSKQMSGWCVKDRIVLLKALDIATAALDEISRETGTPYSRESIAALLKIKELSKPFETGEQNGIR